MPEPETYTVTRLHQRLREVTEELMELKKILCQIKLYLGGTSND